MAEGEPLVSLSPGHQVCGPGLGRGWGREGTIGRELGQAQRKSNHGKEATRTGGEGM